MGKKRTSFSSLDLLSSSPLFFHDFHKKRGSYPASLQFAKIYLLPQRLAAGKLSLPP
jgi:hypothetical protein